MKAWIGALALLSAAPLSAEQTIFAPMRNGVEIVCADVPEIDAATAAKVNYWILGFWSGLNAARNGLVGDKTTTNGVIGEVKLYCASHPSLGLAQATMDTYANMKNGKLR
jgi:hypothetical protein